jgi:hypothetical protein
MKLFTIFLFLLNSFQIFAQLNFDLYFNDKTLRFDYVIGGNSKNSYIFTDKFKEEPFWGGSKTNLIDTFNFGDFKLMVYDSVNNTLLYSRGYSSLYYEWLDTDESKQTSRSFYESVLFPFPKNTVKLEVLMRNKKTVFNSLFQTYINPKSYLIIKDSYQVYKTKKLHYSVDSHKALDIVIIPDGYTQNEMEKFHKDCNRFIEYFFEVEPFKSSKDKVNFWAIDACSKESGTDIPGKNIWKNTILNSHFQTFGSDRYLTTQSIEKVRDIAGHVPYDQIYILVNTPEYGGGGVFNYYNLCSSDHPESGRVFTHEFGHAFSALADEYEYGYEYAEDIYDMSVEPWQVNITNLVNFNQKWKHLVNHQTPIPTQLNSGYNDEIGAFEGAGYVMKKIYRPTIDCKMRSNYTDKFCPICYSTIVNMLKFYSE